MMIPLALAACDVAREQVQLGTATTEDSAEVSSEESIREAALDYVRRETAVTNAEVRVEAVSGDWARATVVPAGGETDPATLYLRRSNGEWAGLSIGTAFAPDDLDRLGVPTPVRPE